MLRPLSVLTLLSSAAAAAPAAATTLELDFQGNGGSGLLPGNEVGANTSLGTDSPAFGGEAGDGLVYDTDRNVLSFDFSFEGLTGGLADIASGIHLHLGQPGLDPFNETGGIVFNLNAPDENVTLTTPNIGFGEAFTAGRVTGEAQLTDAQESNLLDGQIYLNIHSGGFAGGELRGNLVTVPEPASAALLTLGGLMIARRLRG